MGRPSRNLEVKAPCADLAAARQALEVLGATELPSESQTDTYFSVAHGRLKLREIAGRPAQLIWYDRPDTLAAKISTYHLVPISDPSGLKGVLSAALGVRGEVQKQRRIYLWHNVRIHLDEVRGLGPFVEFEAILSSPEDETASSRRLIQLSAALALAPADHLGPSYADLLGLEP
jgi:predicted adenylyl cyclase CyaB